MVRSLAVTSAVALALSLAAPRAAHAGAADPVLAAQGWLDEYLNADTLPSPTKKKPLQYGVFPYAADPCNAFSAKPVDKITGRKAFAQLSACLSAAIGAEEKAEETWAVSSVEMLAIGFTDAKQEKKVRKAVKRMTIVALEVRGTEDAASLHVFFAVDKRGDVRGVFLYVDAAG